MMTIEGADYLLTSAGLALALAGFSGVIGSFRPRERPLLDQEVEGMKLIFESSFGAALFAMLIFPFVNSFGEGFAWRFCPVFVAGFLGFEVMRHKEIVARLRAKGAPPRMEWGLKYVFYPITLFLIFVDLVSAIYGSNSGYLWSIWWMLSAAGMQFFVFVLHFGVDKDGENQTHSSEHPKGK